MTLSKPIPSGLGPGPISVQAGVGLRTGHYQDFLETWPTVGWLHKETAHYAKWRNTVESMMAKPRTSIKYTNVFPDEQGWDSVSP